MPMLALRRVRQIPAFSAYFVETLGGQRTPHPAPTQGQMQIPQSFAETRLAIWICVISHSGLCDPIEFL